MVFKGLNSTLTEVGREEIVLIADDYKKTYNNLSLVENIESIVLSRIYRP